MIALLIVLVIIAILYGSQMGWRGTPDPGTAQYSIERSQDAACTANRSVMATSIMAWSVSHPGEKPTIEAMRASGASVPRCPKGGVYTIGEDGRTVYCSLHDPDPSVTPTPTPTPSVPTAFPPQSP